MDKRRVNRLLTTEEIAEYLRVKKSTIYQWTHTGYIPHIKLGLRLRFDPDQIEKWLRSKTVAGRPTRRVKVDDFLP